MIPILGRYGPYFLTGYFIALGLGALVALAVTAVFARRMRLFSWIDGVLLGAVIALIAGRIVFVFLNTEYFAENPGEAWSVWLGGLNFQAALVAGLLSYLIWLQVSRRPHGAYLDLVAPGLAILFTAGWAGCWMEGCAYGRVTLPGLWSAALPDDFGVLAVRYQTQLAGFLISAVIAIVAAWRLGRGTPSAGGSGALFWLTLAALLTAHAFVTLFRSDLSPIWLGLRADVLVDIILLTLCVVAAVHSMRRNAGGI